MARTVFQRYDAGHSAHQMVGYGERQMESSDCRARFFDAGRLGRQTFFNDRHSDWQSGTADGLAL